MVEKANQENHSTSDILNSLRDTTSTQTLSSPFSFENKKKADERFNDLLYASFIYSIDIVKTLTHYLKKQTEKEIEKFESAMKSLQEQLTIIKLMAVSQNKLSVYQIEQINFIQKMIHDLLNTIKNKITILNQRLDKLNDEIRDLQNIQKQLTTSFSQNFQNYINLIPITNLIHISINLPEQYRNKRNDSERFIELNSDDQRIILLGVKQDIHNNKNSISRLDELIINRASPLIRNKLDTHFTENLIFLTNNEKQSAINHIIQDQETKKLLTYSMLQPMTKDILLHEEISILNEINKDLACRMSEKNAIVNYRDELINLKNSFEENFKLNIVMEDSQTNINVDEQIYNFTNSLNIVNDTINTNEEIFNQTLAELNHSSESADDLLADLDLFGDEIEQFNPDQLEALEKNQLEFESKIQEFQSNLSVENYGEDHDHEIENDISIKKPGH